MSHKGGGGRGRAPAIHPYPHGGGPVYGPGPYRSPYAYPYPHGYPHYSYYHPVYPYYPFPLVATTAFLLPASIAFGTAAYYSAFGSYLNAGWYYNPQCQMLVPPGAVCPLPPYYFTFVI